MADTVPHKARTLGTRNQVPWFVSSINRARGTVYTTGREASMKIPETIKKSNSD